MKSIIRHLVPADVRLAIKDILISGLKKEINQLEKSPFDKTKYEYGINLIGPINSGTGLGQSVRLLEKAIIESEIPYTVIEFPANEPDTTKLKYGINIWHVNASEFDKLYKSFGIDCINSHYNIAYWLWELEEYPKKWIPYINLLDEIWTPAEFVSNAIRKRTDKPVITIPYALAEKLETNDIKRSHFGLPENKFLFLVMYDALSISERKNPRAAIEAYKKAFDSECNDVGLVIKVGSADRLAWKKLKSMIGDMKNVYYIDGRLSREEVNGLIASVDAYVSLHRAEGFGLVMAEAMSLGTPCIATDWSANTEFMNSDVACMVDYELVTLKKSIPPYEKEMRWADANIDSASEYMNKLVVDSEYRNNIIEKAKKHIAENYDVKKIANMVNSRVVDIWPK